MLSLDFVNNLLFEYEFKRVDFVTEPGEFSIRGGIIDVFSFANDTPYRIEFFGDEVESIRTFDVASQLSLKPYTKFQIIPNIEHKLKHEKRVGFLDYIPQNTVVWTQNLPALFQTTKVLFEKAKSAYKLLSESIQYNDPDALFCTSDNLKQSLQKFSIFEVGSETFYNTETENIVEVNVGPSTHIQQAI
jgi:transcription-repair coupling factor (superfamily II helicase)